MCTWGGKIDPAPPAGIGLKHFVQKKVRIGLGYERLSFRTKLFKKLFSTLSFMQKG